MSLTVNALRKLQETGAFPTPAKGAADDPSKQPPADAKSQPDKPDRQQQGQTDEPSRAAPGDAQLEMEPPVSTEPELERPETPVEDDLSVPSNDQSSTLPSPASPRPEAKSPKSLTERLESPARSRSGQPIPPDRDVQASDPTMTMPIPPGGFNREPEEEPQPDIPRDAITVTTPLESHDIDSAVGADAEASQLDPSLTMPIPRASEPVTDESKEEVSKQEESFVDPTKTMPLPPPDGTADVTESEAPAGANTESLDDPSTTQPFTRQQEEQTRTPAPISAPLESQSPAKRDATTPPTPSSANPIADDSVSPTIHSDIESLQAMVSEAVDSSPTPSDSQLRPDAGHNSSSSTSNTEKLESGPGTGERILDPITTETYRLFYDPVIPVVDLDASSTPDSTQTRKLNDAAVPPAPLNSHPSDRSGTEPFEHPAPPSEPAQPAPESDATSPEPDQQHSVVIPTAYERELIEQMGEKEFQKHFQNLHNQLGARSNHQLVGSYLFVSPTQTPRTADVTANLALLLEQYERDVLLIDANLENQTLTRRLEALNQSGLCDVLANGTQPNDVVLPTSLKRLRFVPSGDDVTGISRVPNRFDMHGIRQLLTAWCDDRRTIICDLGSMDSTIALPMAQAFDGVILVVSMVDLNIDAVHAAARVLKENQVRNILGCVVTDC